MSTAAARFSDSIARWLTVPVPDEPMVRHGAVEALLDGRQPGLEAGREVFDVAVQRAEVAVELGGVADEVAGVALAEDDALRRAQLRDPAREHDDPQQCDHRERPGRERGDPGGGRELVHGPKG